MRGLLILVAIIAVQSGCTQKSCELTEERKLVIERELKEITNSIFDLASKKDSSYNKPISNKVTAVFSGIPMESWEKHKRQMLDFFKSQDKIESTIDIIEVNVLSSTSAIVVGKYKIKATDKTGHSIESSPACITYVYSLVNNEWKVIHFHDSEEQ